MFLHFNFLPENNIEHIMYNANPERRFNGIFPDYPVFFCAAPVILLRAGCLFRRNTSVPHSCKENDETTCIWGTVD